MNRRWQPQKHNQTSVPQRLIRCVVVDSRGTQCSYPSRSKNMCNTHYFRWKKGKPMDAPIKRRKRNLGRTCKAEECDEPAKVKLYCLLHYARQKRGVPLDSPLKASSAKKQEERTCKVEGCDAIAKSRGMCASHYNRVYEGRPVDAPLIRRTRYAGARCSVKECIKPASVHHMCQYHYSRWRDQNRVGREAALTPG